jgi:hypothetical protein
MSATKLTDEQAVVAITALVNAAPRKPMPTVEEIQKANREFWPAAPPAPPTPRHPGEAALVQEAMLMVLRDLEETRTAPASEQNRIQGKKTQDRVRSTATQILVKEPRIKRTQLAEALELMLDVGYDLKLGFDTLYKYLTRMHLPARKNRNGRRLIPIAEVNK